MIEGGEVGFEVALFSLTRLWSRSDQTWWWCVWSFIAEKGATSVCGRTRRLCVRSCVTYVDASDLGAWRGSDAAMRPVAADLTRPIVDFWLWMLTGCDLTLGNHGEQRVRSWRGLGARACALTQIGASSPWDGASSLNLTRGVG